MARINKRSAKITIGGTDYTFELAKAVVTAGDADSDFVTFGDAANGGARSYTFDFTAAQDTASGSLWDRVWSSTGTSVLVLFKPSGNATASVSQPHYSFNATIKEPDGDFIGGEADLSTSAVQTIECSWPVDAKPTKITS